ncbi:hypothetical protein Q9F32_002029 [Vibrio parahaemolyticus]|uniref:Uncharacterized protein n=2 Tax=Vibrio parahaemolyticus TaxID=670 RepID=A0A7M1VKT6_VIBPH|nr:polysialyltransferase family glycosyltransferase [Vibrio parahaemolyticus]EGR0532203.1 hypothetical protein [Vibrio parahaemolyticus]EGR0656023.1 hypothetical protein [Vibrio parahaemolyticus]EGR1442084.1 hypothetical protein [Vibrio parahaemolyticus]EGR1551570.1 hypothetical protein [Vibrio parahaemolyticus]EGR1886110.1 hypothetical protein [Vibrio parahaemolyticus]
MNLIICQSPKYLEKSLSLFHEQSDSIILIREVSGVYNFLIDNGFVEKKRLLFVPVYKRNNILNLIKNIYVIKKFCFLNRNKFDDVYLFTNDNDFTTMSILSSLSIKGKLYFEVFNELLIENNFLVELLNKLAFNVKSFQCEKGQAYDFLKSDREKISIGFKVRDYSGVKYKVLCRDNIRNVLLVDSNDEENLNLNCVQDVYLRILEYSRESNISIYIKGHPRLGLSKTLQGRENVTYLDSNIPFELLDLSKFDKVFGFYSTGLCCTQILSFSYSLLPLCKSKKEDYYKEYLKNNGFPLSSFIYSFNELHNVLDS